MNTIAYLAPEIPALSATFVYEELLELELRGLRVVPVTVRVPSSPASGQAGLAGRTRVLYRGSPAGVVFRGMRAACGFRRRSLVALRWLVRDVRKVGVLRPSAWRLVYQWLAAATLGRWLEREGCIHLHVHFAHVPAQIGMYASAFTAIPFTITAHANDIFERGTLLVEKAARATKLLAISQHNLEYLVSAGVPREKVAVVRCGVPLCSERQTKVFEHRARCRIGSLGRLVPKKGMDDLVRAFSLISESCDAELSIAGEGPERDALERLARQLGVADRVHLEGAVPHETVAAWLNSLDVFVLACKPDSRGDMDGIPVALMEAMAQGVPVVSTRLSGIPELVIDGRTGLLVPPDEPPAVAEAILRLLKDSRLRARLGECAIRHINAEFNRSINVDRLLVHLQIEQIRSSEQAPGLYR